MNRFSIGINTKVYDFDIFNDMADFATTRTYNKLSEYIKNSRKDPNNNPDSYIDFENMVNNLKEKGGEYPTINKDSNIKHS